MRAVPSDAPGDDTGSEQALARIAAFDDLLAGFEPSIPTDEDPATPGDDLGSGAVTGLLDTILLLRQAAAADGVVPVQPAAAAPARIGRHTILRLAGDGGFATVWEGFDTLLRRPVAVKVRRPEMLLSESARRRFVREAEIAARLVHPHIVTIFEVGEDQGREFIAAEFCSGGSLSDWLERHPGPMAPWNAARLVRALAGAAATAHAAGVVHRDIKPANVLLVPVPSGSESILASGRMISRQAAAMAGDGGTGFTIKLGDFGLGKLQEFGDSNAELTQLTRTGTSIGTPAWMAPEQVDRSFGSIGPATDVHALGQLLHLLLTGRPLWGGGTDAETYRQVLLDEAVPADALVRGVPRDLAAVAAKCLAKQPQQRYASASDLADDLGRWLAGRPTHARPLSAAGRTARWIRRRPVVAGLAAATLAATLIAIWGGVERVRDARVAARREEEIRRQQAVAELRRGCEALRAGNVAGALAQLEAARELDSGLADSLGGRWLVRRTHGEQAILLAAAATADAPDTTSRDLYAITISPDGGMAAVAGADGVVRLIRGLRGSPVVTAVAAHDEINEVGFSADGTRLVTAGQDGRVRWWAITPTGLEPEGEATPDAGPLYAAAFTPDGRSIAIGGEDRVVRIVSLAAPATPATLFRFEPPPGKSPEIESIVCVDDMFAASCGDRIALVNVATGRLVRELRGPETGNRHAVLGSLTVSADGRRLMACGTDARAHVWNIATGDIVRSLPAHPAWVQGCCFLPDGERVATACRDGSLRVFDMHTGDLITRLVGHVGRVWSVAVEPTGTLLSCGADGTVRRWNPRLTLDTAAFREIPVDGDEIVRMEEGPPLGVAASGGVSPASRPLIVVDRRGHVSSIDTAAGSVRRLGPPDSHGAGQDVAFHVGVDASGNRLAVSWLRSGRMTLFDLPSVQGAAASSDDDVSPLQPRIESPAAVNLQEAIPCWTASGALLICSWTGDLWLATPDLEEMQPLESPLEDPVHALAIAPTSPPRVAAAGKHTAILSLERGTPQAAAAPLVFPIGEESSTVAWSPDGSLLACGTRTGRTLLFDTATGGSRGGLVPHQRQIVATAFSTDGRILITADSEGVRISDVGTLTTLDEIRPGWQIAVVRLTADGRRLVLGGCGTDDDGTTSPRLAVMELAAP